jgi:hypothetical protein
MRGTFANILKEIIGVDPAFLVMLCLIFLSMPSLGSYLGSSLCVLMILVPYMVNNATRVQRQMIVSEAYK